MDQMNVKNDVATAICEKDNGVASGQGIKDKG